ncbi:unnamed protein product [Oncorhynchus mykiss]|uniref:1-acylglycerol-3-phosphate O-acyltransferase n=1 Tax=Oncorhynchus mykiss TaxID=8022 RepID=A0A060XNC1_ONCMY|nr:unnamed protein product [Oncorhynchus mykiss]
MHSVVQLTRLILFRTTLLRSEYLSIICLYFFVYLKKYFFSVTPLVAAVYCCTLNFRNNETPTLWGVLNGEKYHPDLYVRRIPLESIPEDEAECSAWLHKLYQEKDKFQEDYSQTGCFPGPKVTPPCRPWALINWLGWTCLLLYPLCLLLVQLVNSGSLLTIMATVAFCAAVSFGVRWMIGQTEIKRSSSYGVPLNNK